MNIAESAFRQRVKQDKLERRGRLLCLAISLTLVPLLLSGIFSAITNSQARLVNRILAASLSLIMLRSLIAVWLGNHESRRFLSVLVFLKALLPLPALYYLWPIVQVTTSGLIHQKFTGKQALAILLVPGVMLFHLLLGASIAALLRFSPSIQEFVTRQLQDRSKSRWLSDSWSSFLGRPGLIDLIEHSRSGRLVYPSLTPELIRLLRDDELDEAVLDYVDHHLSLHEELSRDEVLKRLPVGVQTYYSLWWLRAEIDNGGFFQFFVNKGPHVAFMALEGCRLLDLADLGSLILRGLKIYQVEAKSLEEVVSRLRIETIQRDWAEVYLSSEKASSLKELNRLYYEVPQPDLWTFIRTRTDLFQSHLAEGNPLKTGGK